MNKYIALLKKINKNQAKIIRDEYKIKCNIDEAIYPHIKKAGKRLLQANIRFSCLLSGIEMVLDIETQEQEKIIKIKNNVEKIFYFINLSLEEIEKLISKA